MATVTTTFSQLSPNVKAVHTGVVAIGSHLSAAATLCPSGRLKMCQVPHGATLLDFWLRVQNAADDDQQTFQIGTSATRSGIMAVTTLSATFSASGCVDLQATMSDRRGVVRAPGGTMLGTGAASDLMPVAISISDDAQPRSVWVIGTLGAGVSASAFFTFMLFYTMDGMIGRTTIR